MCIKERNLNKTRFHGCLKIEDKSFLKVRSLNLKKTEI